VEQVIVIRRDLHTTCRQAVAHGAKVAMRFVAERMRSVPAGAAPEFDAVELEWLLADQAQRCFRVHSEDALLAVVARGRAAGLVVHVGTQPQSRGRGGLPLPVCCALGPAEFGRTDAIVSGLTLW